MKKLLLFFIGASSLAFTTEVLTQLNAGYFGPTGNNFKNIYGGSGIYGYEVNVQAFKGLYAWTSGNYFQKSGYSIGLNTPTKIQLVPLGLGLKYYYDLNWADIYAGIGGVFTYSHVTNDSPFVQSPVSHWGFGGLFKGGLKVNLPARFYLDFFGNYTITNINYPSKTANADGWAVGGGIGYRFGNR